MSTRIVRGSVTDGLGAISQDTRLLVVGAHGTSDHLTSDPLAVRLAAAVHCPLAMVRTPIRTGPDSPAVVVGVDGSAPAAAAADLAAAEAELRSVPLRIVHAEPRPQDDDEHDAVEAHRGREQANALTDRIRAGHPDLAVDVRIAHDLPHRALVAASRDAQLLVMGTRGTGRLRRWLVGSVAAEAMGQAWCSVLVVPERALSTRP